MCPIFGLRLALTCDLQHWYTETNFKLGKNYIFSGLGGQGAGPRWRRWGSAWAAPRRGWTGLLPPARSRTGLDLLVFLEKKKKIEFIIRFLKLFKIHFLWWNSFKSTKKRLNYSLFMFNYLDNVFSKYKVHILVDVFEFSLK